MKTTNRSSRLPLRWGAGVLALALVGGLSWWNRSAAQRPHPALHRAAPVTLYRVVPVAVPHWLEATGTVRSEWDTPVAAQVTGRVERVLVREGDRVRARQPLALLDTRDLDAAVAAANADLGAAQTVYRAAQVAARMETALSAARIAGARANVNRSDAALRGAAAHLRLMEAGPRSQEREQAELAVTEARSQRDLAEVTLNRMTRLYESDAISRQQLDQYRSAFEVAKAQYDRAEQSRSIAAEGSRTEEIRAAREAVGEGNGAARQARASLQEARASAEQVALREQERQEAQARVARAEAGQRQARIARDHAVVAAPFPGIVVRRLADPGALATPGTPLLRIAGGAMRLEAVLPESALAAARIGGAVPVVLDARPGQPLSGHVVEIEPQGDSVSHTFRIKIDLPPRRDLRAGMFGRARFALGQESQLLVPRSSLWQRDGLDYLYVVGDDGLARLRMVTIGEAVGGRCPVLSGLNPGERVVTDGVAGLTDGAAVAERAG